MGADMTRIPVRAIRLHRTFLPQTVGLLILLLLWELAGSGYALVGCQAWAETSKQSIGINTDYPVPDDQTPTGIGVSSTTLIENATDWSGRIISFKGEAIGEQMVRGGMAWIHINDDVYMEKSIEAGAGSNGYNSGQAIWLSSDLARRIRFFGDYKNQGDLVKITGIFNAACAEHGGDMDIHATDLTVVAHGHSVTHEIKLFRAVLAASLLLSSGFLLWIRRRHRSQRL
jgi:hypothetical protein